MSTKFITALLLGSLMTASAWAEDNAVPPDQHSDTASKMVTKPAAPGSNSSTGGTVQPDKGPASKPYPAQGGGGAGGSGGSGGGG
jgi:hypothetical protein